MKSWQRICALCILSLASAAASAQGWFTGGSFGRATQQNYEVGGPVTMRDDTDDSYRVFGGYMISPLQGLVASYINLGTPRYAGPAFGNFTDQLNADGFDMSYIIGWAPGTQNRFSLFGTVGVFAWSQKVRYQDGSGFEKYKDTGTSFSLGVGSEIRLGAGGGSPWGVHFEYQLFKNVGDKNNSGHEYDREVFSVGADYRFGRN